MVSLLSQAESGPNGHRRPPQGQDVEVNDLQQSASQNLASMHSVREMIIYC